MGAEVSTKSKKVARNTVFLYIRMLLLMFIGLFTSRVVLNALGVEDYGTYNVVNSIVMMFTVISNSISTSIGRFLAYEIGSGDARRLKKVFSSAIFIQTGFCILLFILAETVGLWYLNNKIVIPQGREDAAFWVYQASVVMLAVQLFSIPFNSTIIAHEDMKAFALISMLEGLFKFAVAFILYLAVFDKLVLYAILMVALAVVIRSIYAVYCRLHFPESRNPLVWDIDTIRPMMSMGAWSFTAHGIGVFNTQGINLLSNASFGVCINAVRGIAGQIENIVKQFVTNFLTALNPLITKTWAEGGKDYCFSMVRKGCKFSYLIVLFFLVPFVFEADFILKLWLVNVPEATSIFSILAIVCVMIDMMSNSLAQLIVSNGKVALYYIVTSVISALTFFGSWIAYRHGFPAESCYYISAGVLFVIAMARLVIAKKLCGFPIRPFIVETLVPLVVCTVLSFLFSWLLIFLIPIEGAFGSIIAIAVCFLCTAFSVFAAGLSPGERSFVTSSIRNFFHKK